MMTSSDGQMSEIQVACFSIISYVGNAKSCYMQALRVAKEGDFAQARKLVDQGVESYAEGHGAHAALITQEAQTGDVPASLLLMHAEAQLMDAESCKVYVTEYIRLYEQLEELSARVEKLEG